MILIQSRLDGNPEEMSLKEEKFIARDEDLHILAVEEFKKCRGSCFLQ